MNPLDPAQQQRVWSRVMSAPNACQRLQQLADTPATLPARTGAAPSACPDEAALLELYTAQLRASVTYYCLAQRLRGSGRQTLLNIAREKQAQSRKLSAIYYIETGKKPCPDRPKAPCITCVSEALRMAYREEQCTTQLYRAYASGDKELACLLDSLSAETCRHAQQVLSLLESRL